MKKTILFGLMVGMLFLLTTQVKVKSIGPWTSYRVVNTIVDGVIREAGAWIAGPKVNGKDEEVPVDRRAGI